jgi:type VI secretion system protein ImpF
MREPHPIKGARASLFERLAAAGSHAKPVVQDYPALIAAVTEELGRLLNTRCHLRGESAAVAAGTVLDYGVPEFAALSPANESDQHRLGELLAERIATYEPRLQNVRVALFPREDNPSALEGTLVATLRVGSISEPVSFVVAIDRQSVVVDAGEPVE